MKKDIFSILAIAVAALLLTSCYSSRKNGCPMNPQTTSRFRG